MRLWLVVGTGLLATLFWQHEWLLPVKLLSVLIHESWHGITALLSGALLDRIQIDFSESGETLVSGLRFAPGFVLSVSAGYPGSALTGAILLARGLVGRWERVTLGAFSASLLYMSYLFTEPGSLAFYTGFGWAVGLGLLGLLGRVSARLALLVFGTILVWYAFFDLFDFARDVRRTDAGILAAYALANDWPFTRDLSPVALANSISILWSLTMIVLTALILRPVFMELIAPAPAPPPPPADPLPPPFPGEVTPEVQEWLLRHGFGLDGRPLPPELLEPGLVAPPIDDRAPKQVG